QSRARNRGSGRLVVEVALRGLERRRADEVAASATREVVGLHVDAAPETRLASLVGGVGIARPLQWDAFGGPDLELEEGVPRRDELGEAPREVLAAGEERQHLGSRAAEGAVAREVPRKGRRDERAALIRHPAPGKHPLDAAVLRGGVFRSPGPAPDGDVADLA